MPDKQTVELMTSFYDKWTNGKTIEDAFRLAQNEMRQKYEPFYWGCLCVGKIEKLKSPSHCFSIAITLSLNNEKVKKIE